MEHNILHEIDFIDISEELKQPQTYFSVLSSALRNLWENESHLFEEYNNERSIAGEIFIEFKNWFHKKKENGRYKIKEIIPSPILSQNITPELNILDNMHINTEYTRQVIENPHTHEFEASRKNFHSTQRIWTKIAGSSRPDMIFHDPDSNNFNYFYLEIKTWIDHPKKNKYSSQMQKGIEKDKVQIKDAFNVRKYQIAGLLEIKSECAKFHYLDRNDSNPELKTKVFLKEN